MEKTCCNCAHTDCTPWEEPCVRCKNSFQRHDPKFETAPFLWKDSVEDIVNHPSHYTQGGIECIDAMKSAFGGEAVENFCLCNAFKYVWRNRDKNGVEDIDKAIWYLNKLKELATND